MRAILLILGLGFLGGCASLQRVELPVDELHASIRAGELARPGERVSLVTVDGTEHTFEVAGVDRDHIRGESVTVLIEDVVLVRMEEFSVVRTAALVAGTATAAYVALAVVAALSIIDDLDAL